MGLHKFDGRQVIATGAKITGAGTGLNESLSLDDPVEYKIGDIVVLVLETVVAGVTHIPVDKNNRRGALIRVPNLSTQAAMVVDRDLVADALDTMKDRIAQREGDEHEIEGQTALGDVIDIHGDSQ